MALAITAGQLKSDDFILDALPYIDDAEYDEKHRNYAMQLIAEEQKKYPMTKNYLKKFPKPNYDSFLTDRLKNEFARMEQKRDMEKLDMSRYEIPSPAPNTPQAIDRNAWVQSIQNCEAQLENQNLRKINLELMLEYGPEAHLRMNSLLQREAEHQEQCVYQLRSQLFELHSRRKRRQEDTGQKLVQMGTQWVSLVNKNIKLNEAIHELRAEVQASKKRREIDAFDGTNVSNVS